MQLQRNYTLPNCTLTLDGMSDPSQGMTPGAPMTILVNAACQFLGQKEPLSGGSEFFNSLVTTASSYAQEQLSGIRSQVSQQGLVQMKRLESGLHEVSVYDADQTGDEPAHRTELSTVQLFDLVEAIDQFLADGTALPEMKQAIAPLAKRDVPSQEPLSQRAVAPALGATGLAIAAAALFALPAPEIKPPTDGETASVESVAENGNGETAAGGNAGGDDEAEYATAKNAITDEMVLGAIGTDIENRLNSAWTEPLGLASDLSYRVSTSEDGTIVGYEGMDDEAAKNVDQTPLLDELYIPAQGGSIEEGEPLAQFKVTFTTDDKLEVSPFLPKEVPEEEIASAEDSESEAEDSEASEAGDSAEDGDTSSDSPSGDDSGYAGELIDADNLSDEAVDDLTGALYDSIDETWTKTPNFDGALQYRVQLSPDGDVVGYEALNADSRTFFSDIPLGSLTTSAKPDQIAEFRVVFKSSGVLEVGPWDGL